MATIQRGHTFTEHETVSVSAFNNLVDLASLGNVVANDLDDGQRLARAINPGGTPPIGESFISSPASVFLFGEDQRIQYSDGAFFQTPPDNTKTLTLTNNSAVDLITGDVVCADQSSTSGFIIPTVLNDTVTTHPLGVLVEDIASGASGLVAYRGLVLVKLNSFFGLATPGALIGLYDGSGVGPGTTYSLHAATSGTVNLEQAIGQDTDQLFGRLYQTALGGYAYCYIWK